MFLRAAAFRADAFAARFLGGQVGGAGPEPEPTPATQPTGGWHQFWRDLGRTQTSEERRLERERLGIVPRQQRRIDRAAVKIAKAAGNAVQFNPLTPIVPRETILASPEFDRLLVALQPDEGMVAALVQAIIERIAWMTAQRLAQDDEDAQIVALLDEM